MTDEKPSLKGTVVLGYVDVAAAGCRTLLACVACNQYEVMPWNLRSLKELSCIINESSTTEQLPTAQIYNHKTDDITLIVISAHVPDDVAHVVADEILEVVALNKPNKFIVLSSFPAGNDTTALLLVDNGVIVDTFSKLKCGDPFLNSIIQFSLVEQLPLNVLVSEGRKARSGTTPNELDGSKKSILDLNDAVNRNFQLNLQSETSSKIVYNGFSHKDDSSNLMFL